MSRAASRPPWELSGEAKRERVRSMFATITPTYDLMNSVMSLRLHHRWRRAAVAMLEIRPGDRVLDLCCGTGDFAFPLQKAGSSIVGLDFAKPMLERARQKGAPLTPTLGDACAIPFASESFDAVTVGWGLRNVSDLDVCLTEIYRVLKPGGRLVSLDMALPEVALHRALAAFAHRFFLPALGALVGKREAYTYLPRSTERFDSPERLAERMIKHGFQNPALRRLFFGNIAIVRVER